MSFRVGLKTYGLPYMGSKSQIAPWVIRHLPPNDTFVDLFAGGCAVTHAAMRSDKYKHFIANDISDVPQSFVDAINGKYDNETRWISREDFYRLKDSDPYIRYVWSFGNNGRNYLYGRDIEPIKKATHYAVYFNDSTEFEKIGFRIPILLGTTPMERYRELTAWIRNKNVNRRGDIENFARLGRVKQLSSITGLNSHVYELQSADITVYRGGTMKLRYQETVPYIATHHTETPLNILEVSTRANSMSGYEREISQYMFQNTQCRATLNALQLLAKHQSLAHKTERRCLKEFTYINVG